MRIGGIDNVLCWRAHAFCWSECSIGLVVVVASLAQVSPDNDDDGLVWRVALGQCKQRQHHHTETVITIITARLPLLAGSQCGSLIVAIARAVCLIPTSVRFE